MLKVVQYLFFSLMLISFALAKDLGCFSNVFEPVEEDFLIFITKKLEAAKKDGSLVFAEEKFQQTAKKSVEHPEPVKGIQKTTKARTFYYDPTIEVADDIKDNKGNVIAKKGSKVNPLENHVISRPLVFFDATDLKQIEWAKQKTNAIWVLVNGSPTELENKEQRSVYFDQSGKLTAKFKIQQVPAVVFQDGKKLKIIEELI